MQDDSKGQSKLTEYRWCENATLPFSHHRYVDVIYRCTLEIDYQRDHDFTGHDTPVLNHL